MTLKITILGGVKRMKWGENYVTTEKAATKEKREG